MFDSSATPGARRLKIGWLDLVVLAIVVGFLVFVAYRIDNVLQYKWRWDRTFTYILRWDENRGEWVTNLLAQGLFTTIRLTIWGMVLATMIGTVAGIGRVSRALLPRVITRLYVELVRNIPPLVFVFIIYFFVSGQIVEFLGVDRFVASASTVTRDVIGVVFDQPKLFANFMTGLICLSLFEGAYVTEIVRAGIESIETGQWQAAQSLGLTRWQTLRLVVLPQALARILPALAGQLISLIKTSSIVSLIAIQELTFLAGEVAVSTSSVFEVWIVVAGMYFVICFACARLFGVIERKLAVARRT
jgi:polar amino acid transport system permease protein